MKSRGGSGIVLDPERMHGAPRVARAVERYPAVVDLYHVLAGAARGEKTDRAEAQQQDYRQENIAEKDACRRTRERKQADRPIPVGRALAVLVRGDAPQHLLVSLRHIAYKYITSGEGEIRTHGPLRDAGFQDRCFRPLSHLSNTKTIHFFAPLSYAQGMKYLGIDYGTKRIGVAVSDDTGSLAFPLATVASDREALARIAGIAKEHAIGMIVIGESRNYKGEPNEVMEDIEQFKKDLAGLTGLVVAYEPEFMTSAEAARQYDPESRRRLPAGRQGSRKQNPSQEKLDAAAAALLLQGYLDRAKNK